MNALLLPRIAARIFDVPLMVDPRKAAAIMHAVGSRIFAGRVTIEGPAPVEHTAFSHGRPVLGRLGDQLGRTLQADRILPVIIEGVAVIPIEGTLIHKGKWIGADSGETSYEGIQTQVMRARRDPRVRAVAFEVDSMGGEVSGAHETASMIAQLSAEKPTLAILTDDALSAGYLLASQARQIVAPESGRVGSIGVIAMHVDMSVALESEGLKVTLIYSGGHKADFNPFEALPDDVRDRLKAELDLGRDLFAAAVGRGRGRRFSKAQALKTEAQVFRADEALGLGLIDGIGHANQAFEAFIRAVNRAG